MSVNGPFSWFLWERRKGNEKVCFRGNLSFHKCPTIWMSKERPESQERFVWALCYSTPWREQMFGDVLKFWQGSRNTEIKRFNFLDLLEAGKFPQVASSSFHRICCLSGITCVSSCNHNTTLLSKGPKPKNVSISSSTHAQCWEQIAKRRTDVSCILK